MGWFKHFGHRQIPALLPDPEPAPKPVAPQGYYFEVTDNSQLCYEVAMADDADDDCYLVVRLVQTASGNVITQEGVYNLDRPAYYIEFAMSLCLDRFNSGRETREKKAALKQYVGFYPPKEI